MSFPLFCLGDTYGVWQLNSVPQASRQLLGVARCSLLCPKATTVSLSEQITESLVTVCKMAAQVQEFIYVHASGAVSDLKKPAPGPHTHAPATTRQAAGMRRSVWTHTCTNSSFDTWLHDSIYLSFSLVYLFIYWGGGKEHQYIFTIRKMQERLLLPFLWKHKTLLCKVFPPLVTNVLLKNHSLSSQFCF